MGNGMDRLVVWLMLGAVVAGCFSVDHFYLQLVGIMVLCASGFRVFQGRWQCVPMIIVATLFVITLGLMEDSSFGVLGAATFVVLISLSATLLWMSPIPELPTPSGPHAIGLRCVEYHRRLTGNEDAPWLDTVNTKRRLQAYIWYPASKKETGHKRPYFTKGEVNSFSQIYAALGAPGFVLSHLPLARSHAVEDVECLSGSFPLLVFNHGGALWPLQNMALMEELASHGYIVCSVSHPGESAGVLWSDQSITPIHPKLIEHMKISDGSVEDYASLHLTQEPHKQLKYLTSLSAEPQSYTGILTREWAKDSLALVEYLEKKALTAEHGVFSSINFDNRAYAGMSLGGSVSHECCFLDEKAKCGINLDGMNWNYARLYQNQPCAFLQLYADPLLSVKQLQAKAHPEVEPVTQLSPQIRQYNDFHYELPDELGKRNDIVRLILKGTQHMSFTDKVIMGRGPMRKISATGTGDSITTIKLINSLCLTFLNKHVKNKQENEFNTLVDSSDQVIRQVLKS